MSLKFKNINHQAAKLPFRTDAFESDYTIQNTHAFNFSVIKNKRFSSQTIYF